MQQISSEIKTERQGRQQHGFLKWYSFSRHEQESGPHDLPSLSLLCRWTVPWAYIWYLQTHVEKVTEQQEVWWETLKLKES